MGNYFHDLFKTYIAEPGNFKVATMLINLKI